MLNSAARLGSIALLTLLLLPSGATSQPAKPLSNTDTAPPEIVVVTGHRPEPEKLNAIVWKFVYAHANASPKIGQLTRWYTPICPEVRNMPPGYGDFVVKRILAIAKSVGAPTKENCKLNIEIIFTAQPQAIMDRVAEKDSKLLGYHFVHDTLAKSRVTEPIQAWYVTATSNTMQTYLDDPYHGTPGGAAGSRISHGLISVFDHILILANTDVLVGRPIGPVADYIAMLALSQSRAEDDCTELASILDLLSPDCADDDKPQSLTIADKAYLEGLYSMEKAEIGSLERSNISEHMEQTLGGQ